jgi:hypothetical protein
MRVWSGSRADRGVASKMPAMAFTGQALKKTADTTTAPYAPLLTIYLPAGYLVMIATRHKPPQPLRLRVPDRRDRGVSRCRQ